MQADSTYSLNRTRLLNVLTAVTLISMVLTFILALFYAAPDVTQGPVQRIFSVHLGAFTGGTTAFFITVLAGIAYLRSRNPKWDHLALASVEIGLPLMTITLVTGAVWARPTWLTWWTADPRLNSMAVMWLMYCSPRRASSSACKSRLAPFAAYTGHKAPTAGILSLLARPDPASRVVRRDRSGSSPAAPRTAVRPRRR